MAGHTSWKCMECSYLDIRHMEEKPTCYNIKVCARRRSYYRDHDAKKTKMRMRFVAYQNQANECCLCHAKHRLETHHIEPRHGKENRDELSNMLTLCHDCHVIVESYTRKVRVFYSLQESLATGVNVTPKMKE